MICPFRKIVKTVKVKEVYVITEEFAECYEGDCPYYKPPQYCKEERCLKAEKEMSE